MINEMQSFIDAYVEWLKKGISYREIHSEWVEITTPFLDRHNDHVQLFARREGERIVFSDDGYIISDLEQSGCQLSTQKRKELLELSLNGFGVKNNKGKIEAESSNVDFPRKLHNMIQAMLSINDLFSTARASVASLFYEDVVSWFDELDVRYAQNVRFSGMTRYDHMFDFVIPKSKRSPERVVQAINVPSKASISRFAFSWIDIKHSRPEGTVAIAILNDLDKSVPQEPIHALNVYEMKAMPWSQKAEFSELLVA